MTFVKVTEEVLYVLLLQVHQYWRLLVGAREGQVCFVCMINFAIQNLIFFLYQTGLATARRGEISERNQGAGRLCPLQGPQVRDLRGLRQLHVCRIPRHSRTSKSGSFIRIQHQSVSALSSNIQVWLLQCDLFMMAKECSSSNNESGRPLLNLN